MPRKGNKGTDHIFREIRGQTTFLMVETSRAMLSPAPTVAGTLTVSSSSISDGLELRFAV